MIQVYKDIANVSGAPVTNFPVAGGFTTDPLAPPKEEICSDYTWSWQWSVTGQSVNPFVTIQVSNDGTNWDNLEDAINIEIVDSFTFFADILPFLKIRAVITGTDGNISNNFLGKADG